MAQKARNKPIGKELEYGPLALLFKKLGQSSQGPWDPENPPVLRINRNVIFGSLRDDVFAMLIGELSIEEFTEKFNKVALRGKIKLKPGRQFSRKKVGKPKRHHVYRRTC